MVFLSLSSRSCSSSREWSPPPQAEAPGMKCSRCQHENPSDAVFCQECGARLEAACQSCGTPNELSAKFCKKCGQRLNGPQTSQALLASAPGAASVRVWQITSGGRLPAWRSPPERVNVAYALK